MYSGHVAGAVYGAVAVPQTALILGLNHTGVGSQAAVMSRGVWAMPMGDVVIDEDLARVLLDSSRYLEDDVQAHLYEHSLEVQVPFLQYRQPGLAIVPVCLGSLPIEVCQEIGAAVAAAVQRAGRPVLIVASTDMTHYEPLARAEEQDGLAIERILSLDPAGLYKVVRDRRISMCGVVPTTVALVAALGLGAKACRLVRYATSGDITGDYSRVVGYAGFILE